ncbi:MAG: glycosyltransferase family 2 protein [Treponema sp.]|nr:glycosyltransferase family 2 protein [Treponema sp.]
MKGGIIIPVYNHGKACVAVVEGLLQYSYPIILVDDGNGEETKSYLRQIVTAHPEVTLVTLDKNSGKGAAFGAGIVKAHEMGITHALQIDADGQHDIERTPFFMQKAEQYPDAMILGYPEYDASVPSHRKNGRKFANNWAKIVSFESGIVDSMCGFRIYPVEETYDFINRHSYDKRMGFDIDILVRLIWKGLPFLFFPVHVTYPSDGISNFRMLQDNARISWVYTKLCCGMFLRLPRLIAKVLKRKQAA